MTALSSSPETGSTTSCTWLMVELGRTDFEHGIDLPPLGERLDRFDEGVEAIARLLSQETTTLNGRYVRLTEARCEPKPVQRPHPPITIGGRGKTRTLRTAARWAQQWNAITSDPQDWLDLAGTLRSHCADIGRDPGEIYTE